MKRAKRYRGSIVIGIILIAALLLLLTKPAQQSIDIIRDEILTSKRWIDYKLGRPLKGTPDLANLDIRLENKQMKMGDAIFMRIFKLEGELELWMQGAGGYKLFAVYPICRWSGGLGPKLKEGDHQSPEGFYTVTKRQLNPHSRWYRSFNLGYPNVFDKSFKRTGSFLMVHGGCSSIGCYAMTNAVMKELWDFVNAAFKQGQKRFAVHVFPFRMTSRNMYVYSDKKWFPFWRNLKQGYDHFEATKIPPEVSVCKREYLFKKGEITENGEVKRLRKSCPKISAGEKK